MPKPCDSHPSPLLLERQGAVMTVTLNRPEKLNALNVELLDALRRVVLDIDRDDSVKVILLRGAGRAFCAGADRDAVASLKTERDIRKHAENMGELFFSLSHARPVTVASVHGYALGAGCGLVTACRLAVASRETVFGYPETSLGMIPAIVTPPLVQAIGARRAYSMLALGTRLSAEQAASIGLITNVASNDVDADAMAIAETIADLPDGMSTKIATLIGTSEQHDLKSALDAACHLNISDRLART